MKSIELTVEVKINCKKTKNVIKIECHFDKQFCYM